MTDKKKKIHLPEGVTLKKKRSRTIFEGVTFYAIYLMKGKEKLGYLHIYHYTDNVSHIDYIFVDKKYRGMGYAKYLIRAALDEAEKRRNTVTLRADKLGELPFKKIIGLYKSFGFTEDADKTEENVLDKELYMIRK